MKKDKISIVIPVYNTDQYLSRCIDSVLNQTYKNLEIILVNDGSTDKSGEICDGYSQKDNRVNVIHKKNGGCADALNTGIRVTTGEYLGFVDSDDYIETDMYEILLDAIYNYDADMAECGNFYYKSFEKTTKRFKNRGVIIFNSYTALKALIEGTLSSAYWNKLYRKDLINGVEFPVGNIQEDMPWTYKVYARSKKIAYLGVSKYYYFIRKESTMQSLIWLKKLDWFYNIKERLEFIEKNYSSLFDLAQKNFFLFIIERYMEIDRNGDLDKDKKNRDELKKYILTNYYSFYSNKLMGKRIKFLLKIFKTNVRAACYLYYVNRKLGIIKK